MDDKHKINRGLRNQGATCYLNSALQVLLMTPEVIEAQSTSTNEIDKDLRELLNHPDTRSITQHLHINDVWRQHDAAEYLELLLNRLGPDVSKPFRGQLTEKIVCEKDHCIIEEKKDFWNLPLPLSDSVNEGIQQFFESKSFNVYCTECKKSRNAMTSCQMEISPQVLVLLLKRFEIDHRNGIHHKSNRPVELANKIQIENFSFSLCGVVDHYGSAHGGHYTTTMQYQEDWYCFNDTQVCQVQNPTGQRSETSYLLIYRRAAPEKDQTKSEGCSVSGERQQTDKKKTAKTPATETERNGQTSSGKKEVEQQKRGQKRKGEEERTELKEDEEEGKETEEEGREREEEVKEGKEGEGEGKGKGESKEEGGGEEERKGEGERKGGEEEGKEEEEERKGGNEREEEGKGEGERREEGGKEDEEEGKGGKNERKKEKGEEEGKVKGEEEGKERGEEGKDGEEESKEVKEGEEERKETEEERKGGEEEGKEVQEGEGERKGGEEEEKGGKKGRKKEKKGGERKEGEEESNELQEEEAARVKLIRGKEEKLNEADDCLSCKRWICLCCPFTFCKKK